MNKKARVSIILICVFGIVGLTFIYNHNKNILSTLRVLSLSLSPLSPALPLPFTPSLPNFRDNIIEVDFDIDEASNFNGLATLCKETEWKPYRYFTCDLITLVDFPVAQGRGVADVRNAVLNCVRYTIAAGGSLVMPSLKLKEVSGDPADFKNNGRAGLDHFFDIDYFKFSLHYSCPQLMIADSVREVPGFDSAYWPDPFSARSVLAQVASPLTTFDKHAAEFRANFDKVYRRLEAAHSRVIFRLGPGLWDWEISQDPSEFWNYFGRLLMFREDVRFLASEVYTGLVKKSDGLGYFGCHLAAGDGEWKDSFESQTKTYISRSKSSDLTFMYVASGDATEGIEFDKRARAEGMNLSQKEDFLSPPSLQYLRRLPLDQQALVDYLVLLKSQQFAGVFYSSFSQSIASRRHTISSDSNHIMGHDGDEYSFIINSLGAELMRVATWP